jgi:hypothetical protein
MAAKQASDSAAGWSGDRLTILRGPATTVQPLLWSTIWESKEAAERFEQALWVKPTCICRTGTSGSAAFQVVIRREGAKVALACGLPDADLESAATMLLTLPETPAQP